MTSPGNWENDWSHDQILKSAETGSNLLLLKCPAWGERLANCESLK